MAQRVCIIGGGVIGLATAYALVRDGFEVTVIEARDALGSETSFANGGQLSYRYVAPLADAGVPLQAIGWMLRGDSPLKLRPRFDAAQWRWMASFLGACRRSVNRENAAHLLRLALFSQGTLKAWREDDGLAGFQWRRNAIYTPDEEVGDCHAFCRLLATRLQASGRCELRLGQAVTGIRHANGNVSAIDLGEQVLPVDQLVIAAGHRSPLLALPGLQLPLYPLKGYSLTVPIGPEHQAPDVSITDYDRKIVYARIGEQLRVAAMVDIVGFDPAIDPKRLALIKRQARDTFPNAGAYDAATEWAGMRPATPSGVPLLGATAYRNLWLNIGHGALGFTLACGSGRLLSELIGQRRPSIDMHGFNHRAA
jgi:D-amino-acid dehydrogenase